MTVLLIDDSEFPVYTDASVEALLRTAFDANQPRDERGRWTDSGVSSPEFKSWFAGSKITDATGHPRKVYHETSAAAAEAIAREGFRFDKVHARASDDRVPDGGFFKPTDAPIGVAKDFDRVQVPVYLNLQRPLYVETAEDLQNEVADRDSEYRGLRSEAEHQARRDKIKELDIWDNMRQGNASIEDTLVAQRTHIDEWMARMKPLYAGMRDRVKAYITSRGYDGVVIQTDRGSFGRKTTTMIALRPDQIRLAAPKSARLRAAEAQAMVMDVDTFVAREMYAALDAAIARLHSWQTDQK